MHVPVASPNSAPEQLHPLRCALKRHTIPLPLVAFSLAGRGSGARQCPTQPNGTPALMLPFPWGIISPSSMLPLHLQAEAAARASDLPRFSMLLLCCYLSHIHICSPSPPNHAVFVLQAEAAARASGKPPPTESWWQKELEAAEKEAQMEDDDDDAYFRCVGAIQSVDV